MGEEEKGDEREYRQRLLLPPFRPLPPLLPSTLLFLLKGHGHSIHAVAQARRFGSVIKDVAQMSSTDIAEHFRTNHAIRFIRCFLNGVFSKWRVEAWPPRTRIELRIGREQGIMATSTVKCTVIMNIIQGAGKSPFSAVFAQYTILVGRQDFLPFGVRFNDPLRWVIIPNTADCRTGAT